MGIQDTVRQMIGKHQSAIAPIGSKEAKGPYDFANSFDLYYLTKHIMNEKSIPVYAKGMNKCYNPPCIRSKLTDVNLLLPAFSVILKLHTVSCANAVEMSVLRTSRKPREALRSLQDSEWLQKPAHARPSRRRQP